jgi:phosphatidylglycerol:prolipoprotein diacylglycerol transferase
VHFPVDFHIGSLVVPSHLVFELLAYTIGFRYFLFLRRNSSDTISTENRIWIVIGAAAGALSFSRIIGILENPELLKTVNAAMLIGNKTIVGGLLGGLLGVEIIKKKIGVKTSSGDLMTYPIILAIAIGRIGCFLTGLNDATYGTASNLPWSIDFGDGIHRHPTQLYEIIFLMMLFLFLKLIERNFKLSDGSKFKIFMVGYLAFRLLVEFIKPRFYYLFGLSLIQLACIAGLVYYYRVFFFPKKLFLTRSTVQIHG